MATEIETSETWSANWLDGVENGSATMSQRARSAIDKNGGIAAATAAAKSRGFHLAELTNNKRKLIVAASRDPFKTLC
jgi:hypothetical protein